MIVDKVSETADDIFCAKKSGRFLHRDRPLANIYVNNQKVQCHLTRLYVQVSIAVSRFGVIYMISSSMTTL